MINHLWQSSAFAILAALLALVLRKSPAKVRYWIWLSASLKFLVPLTLLVSLGTLLPHPAPSAIPAAPALLKIAEPYTPAVYYPASVPNEVNWIAILWILGFFAVVAARGRAWLRLRAVLRTGTPIELPIPIRAVVAQHTTEPGIVGFLRPVLVLPPRLLDRLNAQQLTAVLAHEMCHVRRRDNLFAALHMLVEAIFWFNPLVWWIGSRLVEERERACDEAVLRTGCEPADYADGILQVCRLYKESPLPCVSGVTGADVKKRLRTILSGTIAREWTASKKIALATAGLAILATPIAIGILNAAAFEAASIRPAEFPTDAYAAGYRAAAATSPCNQGQLKVSGTLVSLTKAGICDIIRLAYGVRSYQIFGVPSSLGFSAQNKEKASSGGVMQDIPAQIAATSKEPNRFYDIEARSPGTATPDNEEISAMLRELLAERFHLGVHRETRELAFLALVQAKEGAKLKPASETCKPHSNRSLMAPCGQTMEQVARYLNTYSDREIIDRTGLTGKYDYEIPIERDDPDFGASVTAAIQNRLGLRLEPQKGSVEVLVVDRMERPTEN